MLKTIQINSEHFIVSFCWSKTIQFVESVLRTPLISIPESVLCPLKAFQNMYNLFDTKEYDPLFTLPYKNAFYKGFQLKLRLLIKAIGLNSKN